LSKSLALSSRRRPAVRRPFWWQRTGWFFLPGTPEAVIIGEPREIHCRFPVCRWGAL